MAAGRFVYGPSLAINRASCQGVKLDPHRAIVLGGYDGISRHSSTEMLDIPSMQFSAGPEMLQARSGMAAILIEQETLLVAGGYVGKIEVQEEEDEELEIDLEEEEKNPEAGAEAAGESGDAAATADDGAEAAAAADAAEDRPESRETRTESKDRTESKEARSESKEGSSIG